MTVMSRGLAVPASSTAFRGVTRASRGGASKVGNGGKPGGGPGVAFETPEPSQDDSGRAWSAISIV
jgi:hypothetical protein